MTLIHFYQGIVMKKAILLAVTAIVLAACADTRNHIHKDSTQWETNVYNVKRDTQELTDSQKETAKHGEAEREYKDGVPTFR